MIAAFRRLARDTGGATAVEFALLIAPFMMLTFGIIEVSRALWTRQALQDVAIATARCIGVGQLECTSGGNYSANATQAFLASSSTGLGFRLLGDETRISRNVTCDGMPGSVKVKLEAEFDSVFPFNELLGFEAEACFYDWSAA